MNRIGATLASRNQARGGNPIFNNSNSIDRPSHELAASPTNTGKNVMRRNKILMEALLASLLSMGWLRAGTLHLIAVGGQPVPDGNGVFSSGGANDFRAPALNNRGVVTFYANVSGASGNANSGVFCGVPGLVAQVARARQQMAVLGGAQILPPSDQSGAINDTGQVAFLSQVPPVGGFTAHAILRKGPTRDGFKMVARSYDPAPGEGSFRLGSVTHLRPVLGSSGHVAFYAELSGTDGGTADNVGIFRSGPLADSVVRIVQKGDPVPGGNGTLTPFIKTPAIHGGGAVAFVASIAGIAGSGPEAIVRGDGSSLTLIARTGTPVPGYDPIRHFWSTTQVPINDSGVVAFVAETTFGGSFEHLLLKGDGSGILEVVSPPGLSIPGTGRKFGSPSYHACLNNAGQIGFVAESVTDAGHDNRQGLFRDQTLVALVGQAVPGGGGTFTSFNSPFALNEAGQMAFKPQLSLNGIPGTSNGLYFWDGSGGLQEIVRQGSPFLGSTITGIDFAGTSVSEVLPSGMNGLNNAGEVAFEFALADGREGIALWSDLPKQSTGAASIASVAGGFRVGFPGIAGWDYLIERDDDLLPPWGNPTGAIQADANGWVTFDDLGPGLPARRFYRCIEAP
jgi:hypothetical protein